jgi:hypothetical protein
MPDARKRASGMTFHSRWIATAPKGRLAMTGLAGNGQDF